MSIVVYNCDTCNREIELPQNKEGLEVVQRCIITSGCRGKLHQIALKLNHIRWKLPDSVVGLDDWTRRNVLYNHTQTIQSISWTVTHNLGVIPTIQVFVERATSAPIDINVPCSSRQQSDSISLLEVQPYNIEITSVNEFVVTFNTPEAGMVQCVARSSIPVVDDVVAPVTSAAIQLTNGAELSIATKDSAIPATTIPIIARFITPDGTVIDITYTVDTTPATLSPWSTNSKVLISGEIYQVRSFNVVFDLLGNILPEFLNTAIPNGSSLKIITVNDASINQNSNEFILLLAKEPYAFTDRIMDRYVNATSGISQETTSFFYNNAEISMQDSIIENTYPYILEV